MTEDIGSNAHRRPSSADIDMAERMAVIKERQRQADARDVVMSTQLDIIISKLSAIQTALKKSVEDDKRSPLAIVLATLSALGAGAVAFFK